jgi:hypothetical protein
MQILCLRGYELSLKENIDAIKSELSTEEQFLESIIKIERVYKKYKKPIIAAAVTVVFVFAGYAVSNYIKKVNIKTSNEAYLTLLKNPDNKEALKVLQNKNTPLYNAYLFQKAMKEKEIQSLLSLSNGQDPIIADIAAYQSAVLKADEKKISAYSYRQNGILKNFTLLEDGYLLLKEGKIKEAKEKFSQIPHTSALKSVAINLEHYAPNANTKKLDK